MNYHYTIYNYSTNLQIEVAVIMIVKTWNLSTNLGTFVTAGRHFIESK